jgi:predicted GNAT family N-acyltransferase
MKKNLKEISIKIVENEFELKKCFIIREEVFVNEQKVPVELELDEKDKGSIHFLALNGDNAIGTLRINNVDDFAKIERVAILKAYRGYGIGNLLLKEAINYITSKGYKKIKLSAQVYCVPFYSKLGFETKGEIYFDVSIEHIDMIKII